MADDRILRSGEPNRSRLAYLDLMREIEDLLYTEADLLDERRYDEWLELFTDDVTYWMPMRKNVGWADRDRDTTDLGPITANPTIPETLNAFIDCVRRGTSPPVTVGDGVATLELVEACRRSSCEGRTVSMAELRT